MGTMRVALTGGIATGKSHCLRAFAALGVRTLDADVLARQAVEPGTAGLTAVVARFGPSVLRPDGALDRTALGRIVFADPAARRDLEAIVHPVVYAAIEDHAQRPAFDECEQASGSGFSLIDIPLLFETGREGDFDRVVVAACRDDQQLTRLMARDGLGEAEARARIATQIPVAQKASRADYVIDTSGAPADTDRQVIEVFERLRAEASRK
jgi:dephospho-CoA kinase